MTALEIVPPEPYLPATRRDTDGWIEVVAEVAKLATFVSDTELVPAALRKRPAAIAAVMLYGREVGLPPMTALRTSFVIGGRVGLSAEAMRALVLAAGHEIVVEESTGSTCTISGRRKGSDRWQSVVWTLDVARHAGIALNSGSWSKYPRQMLKARASAELCRDLFPDVIGGYEAREEITSEPYAEDDPGAARTPVRRQRAGAAVGTPEPRSAKSGEDKAQTALAVATSPSPEPPLDGPVPLPGEAGYEQIGTVLVEPERPAEPAEQASEGEQPERDPGDWNRTAAQSVKMHAGLYELGIGGDRDVGLALFSRILGREVDSSKTISRAEARVILDTLERVKASQWMRASLAAAIDAGTIADWMPGAEPDDAQLGSDEAPPDPPRAAPPVEEPWQDVPLPLDDDEPPRIL